MMVTELTLEDNGVWKVATQGSVHILDLDNKTVTRIPGDGRSTSVNDCTRPLRTLDVCRVGERGLWTMVSDDVMLDYYWHVTSKIRRIEPFCEEDNALMGGKQDETAERETS